MSDFNPRTCAMVGFRNCQHFGDEWNCLRAHPDGVIPCAVATREHAEDVQALEYALKLLGTDAEIPAGTAMLAARYVELRKLNDLQRPGYSTRKGPKTEVTYSCFGCEFHRFEEGHCGRRYLCAEPTVLEKHGTPQYTCTSKASAPRGLCPYLDG